MTTYEQPPFHDDDLIADIVDDGADYIEKNGWHKGDLYEKGHDHDHPPACFMGGLIQGNQYEDGSNKVQLYYVVTRVQEALEMPGSLAAWNDHAAQDKQEVLDKMRLAAKRIRGSHD